MTDIQILQKLLPTLKTHWDGKESILEMKDAEYNQWRQMEWWGFYFEFLCGKLLSGEFEIPGDKYNNTAFDLKRDINWDLKAHAIKSNSHMVIMNDVESMKQSIEKYGKHGEIIDLCDVVYNDVNRTFQKWHSEIKGGKSAYELAREERTSISRYRKTSATLTEILLIEFTADDLDGLSIMKQGRNSNGHPRPEKYMLDIEDLDGIRLEKIEF